MERQAHISSTEAVETFRTCVVRFLTKAKRSVDDVTGEVMRTRNWIQMDQRMHWEGEMRRRTRKLEQAQQELMTARLSALVDTPFVQIAAVRKAQAAVEEAEAKLRMIKMWTREFDRLADPMVKRLESLRGVLEEDMPKAIAYLVGIERSLDAYANTRLDGPQAPPAGADPATSPPADPSTPPS